MPTKNFYELGVWKKAHQFVLDIYKFTNGFPKSEMYGLTSQFRRVAISIPANIAEGYKKRTKADKYRFYNISQGSAEECRYYLILAKDRGYGDTKSLNNLLDEVIRLLTSYSKSMMESKP